MGNSFLLIVAGLLIFYLVISDKWKCVEGFAACIAGKTNAPSNTVAPTVSPAPSTTTLANPQLINGIPTTSLPYLQSIGFGI